MPDEGGVVYPIDISHTLKHNAPMNAPSKITRKGKLFKSNRSQAVRIPKDLAFPDDVKDIVIRRLGDSIMITPEDKLWDDFFAKLPIDDSFVAPEDLPPQERDFGFD
jgi:antitoxin VapB